MATQWVTVRCPRCGAYVAAPARLAAPASWATCPHCQTILPVVAPRDPPPLFSWEVYPSVYPSLPPPRAPGRRFLTVVALALVACTAVLAGVGGYLAVTGAQALGPATFEVSGVVLGPTPPLGAIAPIAGAIVNLSGENGFTATAVTNFTGAFQFTGIPSGGVALNVSAPGYASAVIDLFVSSSYRSSLSAGGLLVTLGPSASTNTTVEQLSPFTDLESFLTSVWSGTALFAIAALITSAGAWTAYRGRRAAVATAGGAAALAAPAALFTLGDTGAFPLLEYPTLALAALGALALTLALVPLLWEGSTPEPNE
jgi:hypothetical protein